MYICLCKGITEEKLKRLAKTTNKTQDILKKLGVGDDCGVCLIAAIDKILEAQSKSSSTHNK